MDELTKQLIKKHFRKPDDAAMTDDEWFQLLDETFAYGCDWLEVLVDRCNPLPAAAVEQMACVQLPAWRAVLDLVAQMRIAQRNYFRNRRSSDFKQCKLLEWRVDQMLDQVLDQVPNQQNTLFSEESFDQCHPRPDQRIK